MPGVLLNPRREDEEEELLCWGEVEAKGLEEERCGPWAARIVPRLRSN